MTYKLYFLYFCFFQIMFEGTAGNSFTGDIAIDSVKINKGGCPGKNVYVKYIVDMVPAEDEWALFSHRKKTRRDEYGGLSEQDSPRAFYCPSLSVKLQLYLGSWIFLVEGGRGGGGGLSYVFSSRFYLFTIVIHVQHVIQVIPCMNRLYGNLDFD